MTFTTVVVAVALIVFAVTRRMRGEAVTAPKKLFALPVVVGAIGVQNVAHAKPNAIALGVVAAGCALSLGFGLLRGRLDRVSMVDGAPYMAWSVASVAVFAVNVLAKLALDAGGAAAGGTAAALNGSILLSLGITLVGEAIIVWQRARSLPSGEAGSGKYRWPVQQSDRPTVWPPVR